MKFEDQTFKKTDVTLDYNEFVNCKFVACTIHFAGGQYKIDGCDMDNCKFSFHDAALRTLAYVKMIWSMSGGPEVVRGLLESTPKPPPMKLN